MLRTLYFQLGDGYGFGECTDVHDICIAVCGNVKDLCDEELRQCLESVCDTDNSADTEIGRVTDGTGLENYRKSSDWLTESKNVRYYVLIFF